MILEHFLKTFFILRRFLPMKFKRGIAGLTLTAFIFSLQTPFLYAGSDLKTAAAKSISPEKIISIPLPESLGKQQETYQGTGSQTVVILQDAHSIPEAQARLRGLIDFFQKKAGISLVALEGAEGPLDTEIFKSFPDQSRLKRVLKTYQEKGELSGGVAAALFNERPSVYAGMEDWDLYEQGIRYYLEAQKNFEVVDSALDAMADALTQAKQRAYSKELFSVDLALENFYTEHSRFEETLKALAAAHPPESGSELALMVEEIMRHDTDVAMFEAGIQTSAEKVLTRLSVLADTERLAIFNRNYQDFKISAASPEAFAAYLQMQASDLNVSLDFSEELLLRIEHQKKLQAIEGTHFFRQFETYARTVKTALIQNHEQALLDQTALRLRWLRKMARLEMTFEEWRSFRAAEKSDNAGWLETEKSLLEHMNAQRGFYETAEKRDGVFFKNLTSLMTAHRQSAVIAVAGGFHAEGLMRQCRKKGFSYVLVMPALSTVPLNNPYREHMQGRVSWKNYFRVENGKVSLYDAFVRSVRDQLLNPETPLPQGAVSELLSMWRGQLIRNLVSKNKVSELPQYTRFLDEAAKEPEDPVLVQWKSNIYRFMDYLRRLETLGSLNETEIQTLLKAAMSTALADGPAMLTHRDFRAELLGVKSSRSFEESRRPQDPILARRSEMKSAGPRNVKPVFLPEETVLKAAQLRSEVRVTRRSLFQIGAAALVGLSLIFAVTFYRQAQPQEEAPPAVVLQLKTQPTDQLTIEDQGKATALGLFSLIEERTGLVVDKARMDAENKIFQERNHIDFTKTSPTNIGLELVAVVIARDQGWIAQEDAEAQIAKMVWTLEQMSRVRGFWYNWYDLADLDSRGVPKVALNQFISSVDNANLTAGLMVVQSALEGTPASARAKKLLEAQDWSFFYNANIGLIGHGYDVEKKSYSQYGYGTFNTEARLLAFISVLRGVDQKVWDRMSREVLAGKNDQLPVVASWGGSLFETLFADAFMAAPDPIAQNNRDTVQIHRDRAAELGYPFWGWSPAQNAKDPDLYEEAGIPEIGARDRGKGYPVGAVSPYSSLLAARYVDREVLIQNLANMRKKNPQVFSVKSGYRDAIDPRTGKVSSAVLSLDKGMELLGFDMMLQMASKKPGTAEKYFWQYLTASSLAPRAKELLAAEKQKFEQARLKYEAGLPNAASKFSAVFSLMGKSGSGDWNNQSNVTRRPALDLTRRTESIEEIDYDVTAAGSFGGTFYKQFPPVNPADFKATHMLISLKNVTPQGIKTSFKIELKHRGRPVQEIVIKGVTDDWQELVFPLNPELKTIDEVVTVFVHDPAGVNRGRLRITKIALAAEKKESPVKSRPEVRKAVVPALTAEIRFVAAWLYPGTVHAGGAALDNRRRAGRIASAYRKMGGADAFEAAVIAQAETLSTRAFDEVMRSLSLKGDVMPAVAIGIALPESVRDQAPGLFWKGFTAAFSKGEISELFKQGGRFDAGTEKDLESRDIRPRDVKLSQSHELQTQTDQSKVPVAIFDYRGSVNGMFFPLEIQEMRKAARSPRAAQFLGFLVGRILKTQADLLRRQPKLSGQPSELKKELLAALWAQGFSGLEMGQGTRPNSFSLSSVSAMLVMQNLISRQIETAA